MTRARWRALLAAAFAVAALAVAGGVAVPGARADALLGSLSVQPASGTDVSAASLRTVSATGSAGCPVGTVSVRAVAVRADGTTATPLVVVATETSMLSTSADFTVPFSSSFHDAAAAAGVQLAAGRYDLTLSCLDQSAISLGRFAGPVWFTSATSYQSTDPAGSTAAAGSTAQPTATGTTAASGSATAGSTSTAGSISTTGSTNAPLPAGAIVMAPLAVTTPVLGTLNFIPATGLDSTTLSVQTHSTGTQKGCPANDSSGLSAFVTGPGGWAKGIAVIGFNTAALSTSSEITVPFEDTLGSYATVDNAPLQVGRYDVTLFCVNAAGSDYSGEWTGSIWFTTTTTWQGTDPNNSQVQTSTTLDSSPLYRVDLPGTATLVATVTPPTVSGTVQFSEEQSGALAKVGSPVALVDGRAVFAYQGIPFGMHYFHADFVPSDPAKALASSSNRLIFVVGKPAPPGRGKPATISGTATVGSVLTCSATFTSATSLTYAWLRDGTVIGSATSAEYRLVGADAGHSVACQASAGNLGGTTASTSGAVRVSR